MASNPFGSPAGPTGAAHGLHHPSYGAPQTGHAAFAPPTASPYGLAAPQHQQAHHQTHQQAHQQAHHQTHQPQSHAQHQHRYAPPLSTRSDIVQSTAVGPNKAIVKRSRGGARARPVSRAVSAIDADSALFDPSAGASAGAGGGTYGSHHTSGGHGGQSSLLQQLQQQQAQQQRSLSHGHHTASYSTTATHVATSGHGHHSQTTHHSPHQQHHHHQQAHALPYQRMSQLNGHSGGPNHLPHHQTQAAPQHHPHQPYHQSVVVPTTGPSYEADGIQFKLLEELPEAKVKRLRSEKIKPIEDLTFEDIKAYNRNQLRAYCFVYGIKRKKKAEMEQNMARYAAMFHPNDPSFDVTTFEPTDYVDGPIPRRRFPVSKEQKLSSAGKFAARFLPTQRPRPAESLHAPHFSAPSPASGPPPYSHAPVHTQSQSLHTQQYQPAPPQTQHRQQQHQQYYNVPLHNFADIE